MRICTMWCCIDGRKGVHDAMRYTVSGQGTYDIIVPKFLKMAKMREHRDYFVRGTFTGNNLDFAKDVLHLADLGFKSTSIEPVVTDAIMIMLLKRRICRLYLNNMNFWQENMLKRIRDGNGFGFSILQ